MTTSADPANFQGYGTSSYGTTFEVVGYDANRNLVPLLFAQIVGTEREETWTLVFSKLNEMLISHLPGRVTIVGKTKAFDTSFSAVMKHA